MGEDEVLLFADLSPIQIRGLPANTARSFSFQGAAEHAIKPNVMTLGQQLAKRLEGKH
jgi:hypothetical protein